MQVPRHIYFIRKNIDWDKVYRNDDHDQNYPIKVGQQMLDTMFILTDKKLILIRGLYSYYSNDSIRMPESGEFGVNYNVMDKGSYHIDTTEKITLNNETYIKNNKVEYQWWDVIKDNLVQNRENSIQVSRP